MWQVNVQPQEKNATDVTCLYILQIQKHVKMVLVLTQGCIIPVVNINSSCGNPSKFSGNRANYVGGSSFRGRGRGGRSRRYNQNSVTLADEESCDGDYTYNEEHRVQNNASTVQQFMLTAEYTKTNLCNTYSNGYS